MRAHVALQADNLLPCTQHGLAIGHAPKAPVPLGNWPLALRAMGSPGADVIVPEMDRGRTCPAGTMPDTEIARRTKRTTIAVAGKRRGLKIPAANARNIW